MAILILGISVGVYAAYLLDATEVTYNKSGTTITVKAALDELYAKARYPKVGDVVNYNANRSDAAGNTYASGTYTYAANTTDTTANDYTGGTTSSTYSSEDSMVWKILDINNETGAIKLLAANGTPASLQLEGRAGWAYCENILNNISEVYGHGYGATGARSVTVEDINNVTGYNPVANGKGMHTQTYTSGSYFFDLTYENGKVKSFSNPLITASTSSPYTLTEDMSYSYEGTDYLSNTANTYFMIFYDTNWNFREYFLASRSAYLGSTFFNYQVRAVYAGKVTSRNFWYGSGGYGDGETFTVCPLVSLSSGIQLTWDSTNNRWNIN